MIRHCALLGLASIVLTFAADPARAAVTTFSDSTFNLADYSVTTYTGAAGFTTAFAQSTGVGGVGTALQTSYEKTGSTSPAARFHALNSSFVYDPSASGDILSIDMALDQRVSLFHNATQVNLASAGAQVRILAEQDGKLYLAARNAFTGLPFDSFISAASSGFLANEFTLFDTANPFAPRTLTGLDFGGSAITFGFELAHFGVLSNGGPSTGLVRSKMAIDNLKITLNTQDRTGAVPEPATWALMIAGFGLAGAALRRSRQAAAALS
jgi:hypothetical protein